MKKLKFTFAAILTFCIMQGAWAVAPGGALGGGTKKGQQQKESSPRMAAPSPEAAMVNESVEMLHKVEETTAQDEKPSQQKVNIGKTSQEGQSANAVDPESFDRMALAKMSKRDARKELKKRIRALRNKANDIDSPSSTLADDMLILLVILCFFIPPLAVYLATGEIGFEFWISLLLTLLFFLPGVIYSLIVVLR